MSVLELRKEKSRDAARSRRGKENYEFYQLAKMLPLPNAITTQLDKASIIRLITTYLKSKKFASSGDPVWSNAISIKEKSRKTQKDGLIDFECNLGDNILQALEGFAFTLSNDGRILYISETVSIYLGLSQVEMTGNNILDYVHLNDQRQVAKKLGLKLSWFPFTSASSCDKKKKVKKLDFNYDTTFCIRMKSTLSKRGNHIRQSGYRVLQLFTHFRPNLSSNISVDGKQLTSAEKDILGTVGIVIAPPSPALHEIKLEKETFIMRLAVDFTILSCEAKFLSLFNINSNELVGKVFYHFCHSLDLPMLRRTHLEVIKRGQVVSDYYRFINKTGGYVWLLSSATLLNTAKNFQEENILFITHIISKREETNSLYMTNCELHEKQEESPSQKDKRPLQTPNTIQEDTQGSAQVEISHPGEEKKVNYDVMCEEDIYKDEEMKTSSKNKSYVHCQEEEMSLGKYEKSTEDAIYTLGSRMKSNHLSVVSQSTIHEKKENIEKKVRPSSSQCETKKKMCLTKNSLLISSMNLFNTAKRRIKLRESGKAYEDLSEEGDHDADDDKHSSLHLPLQDQCYLFAKVKEEDEDCSCEKKPEFVNEELGGGRSIKERRTTIPHFPNALLFSSSLNYDPTHIPPSSSSSSSWDNGAIYTDSKITKITQLPSLEGYFYHPHQSKKCDTSTTTKSQVLDSPLSLLPPNNPKKKERRKDLR